MLAMLDGSSSRLDDVARRCLMAIVIGTIAVRIAAWFFPVSVALAAFVLCGLPVGLAIRIFRGAARLGRRRWSEMWGGHTILLAMIFCPLSFLPAGVSAAAISWILSLGGQLLGMAIFSIATPALATGLCALAIYSSSTHCRAMAGRAFIGGAFAGLLGSIDGGIMVWSFGTSTPGYIGSMTTTIGGVVFTLTWGLSVWAERERRAQTPGSICPACGYDLTGLAPGRPCPECGTPPPSLTSPRPSPRPTPRTSPRPLAPSSAPPGP